MKMRGAILILPLGFVTSALLGCAASATPTKLPPTPTAGAPVPSPIEYTRVGGFAGFNDSLKIDAKGHAVVTRRLGKAELDLDDATLKKIYTAFQTAGFASIPENSMPIGVPADGFSYTLTYQGRTVKTADTAVPKALEPLFELLNQYVNLAR